MQTILNRWACTCDFYQWLTAHRYMLWLSCIACVNFLNHMLMSDGTFLWFDAQIIPISRKAWRLNPCSKRHLFWWYLQLDLEIWVVLAHKSYSVLLCSCYGVLSGCCLAMWLRSQIYVDASLVADFARRVRGFANVVWRFGWRFQKMCVSNCEKL